MKRIKQILITFFIFFGIFANQSFAQEEAGQTSDNTYKAKVTEILEKNNSTNINTGDMFQKLQLTVNSKGDLYGKSITLDNIDPRFEYKVGEELMIYQANADTFYIADQVRTDALLVLFVIFLIMVVLISKWMGVGSLIGMVLSFVVIIYFMLPKIAAGDNPILIAILGSLIIIPLTFYPSHGINRKTTLAVFSTLIALLVTGFLAKFFIGYAKLSGLSSEEAGFLQAMKPGLFNMQGLLLAGIIIGVLGVLDDVTVSQAAIVEQLKITDPKLNTAELYKKAMDVGHDHISSMVNTLVLVYAGASLPLLLLFNDAAKPFGELVNYEIVADEIVRTLVGSIGLILAVPISTLLSAIFAGKKGSKMSHDHQV